MTDEPPLPHDASPPRDPWAPLAARTPARIALGRAGVSLPTREVLAFALAHASARDAVHASLDADALARDIAALGLTPVILDSAANDRAHYLRRPDHGRTLSAQSRECLEGMPIAPAGLALVIGDGLSASAVTAHAVSLITALLPLAHAAGISIAPVVAIVRGARVAIADAIGQTLQARAAAMLIGERPGLSSPDSLGVYLTYAPRPGRTDAERNCISNIRPAGLPIPEAAAKLAWLAREALHRNMTGIGLKDDSGAFALPAAAPHQLGRD